MNYTYYLGRIEKDVLDKRRKDTTLEGMHAEAKAIGAMPHPFLWEGYEDIERHSPETIEDDLKDVPNAFTDKPFFTLKLVDAFYDTFSFRPIFVTKAGMEALVDVFRKQGMDVSDYEREIKKTNWDTHALMLYGF